jgi:hypothetical protein
MSGFPRTASCLDIICPSLNTEIAQLQSEAHQGGCLRLSLRRIDIATHRLNKIWLLVVSTIQGTTMQHARAGGSGVSEYHRHNPVDDGRRLCK